jgi:integrase
VKMTDKKRANGLGSKPKQRKDGRFYSNYTVYVRGPKGKIPKLKTVYGKTPTECERNLIRALAERDDSVLLDSHNPQLADYLPWWLEKVVADTVKQTTWDGYAQMASRYLAPILGHVKLKELDQDHVLDLKSEMLSSGLSNRTVRYAMQTLGKALGYAVVRGTIPANPVRAVKPPRRVKRQLDVWGLEDVLRFFDAARQDRMGPLYVLAATTGLREGEILGLWWRDVHLNAPSGPMLRIQRNLVRSSKGVEIEHLKTNEGRPVELTRMGVGALRRQREQQEWERTAAGGRWGVPRMERSRRYDLGDLVFTTRNGTHIDPSNLSYHHFRKFLGRAGLPRIRFHDLRHTLATVMFSELQAHPKAVQGMFGHKDIKITMDTYTHYLPTMQGPYVARLDELFGEWADGAPGVRST